MSHVGAECKGRTGTYFESQIKIGENKYKKIYVWKPEKRTDFIEVQTKKGAIHLYNLTERGKFLNFNEHSSYEEINDPLFEADKEIIDESAVRTIASLEKVPTEQIISLKAKVVKIYDVEFVTVRGSPINNRELQIDDETAKMKLLLWGDQCYEVEKDKTYFFRMFRLKRNNKETYVNTPKNREFCSIEETKDFAEKDGIKLETKDFAKQDGIKLGTKDFAKKDGIKLSIVDVLFGCFPLNPVKPFRTTTFKRL